METARLSLKVQVDRGEWGTDLPSVETQIENFKSVHEAIEEFQMSLKEAKSSEVSPAQLLQVSSNRLTSCVI